MNPNVPYLKVTLRSGDRGETNADRVAFKDSSEGQFIDQFNRVVDVFTLKAHALKFPAKGQSRPGAQGDMSWNATVQPGQPCGGDPVIFLFTGGP